MKPLRYAFIRILTRIIILLSCLSAAPAAVSEDSNGSAIGRLASPDDVQKLLDNLHARYNAQQESRQLSFALQKTIAEQSGACIERLVDLSQGVDLSRETEQEAFKAAFLKNGDLLRRMIADNQTRVDDMLEARLEQMQDKDALFASPEWQQPQYLIGVASYWLGWNNYYAALLCTAAEQTRSTLLDEAVSCFTRTLPHLQEQSLANRCVFGRALCFKEQKKYDKALQDIQSLMAKVSRADELYVQVGYERALITYLSGESERAIKQIQELQAGGVAGAVGKQIRTQLKQLQTTIALAIAGRKTPGVESGDHPAYRQALKELRRIVEGDPTQAGVLYRYVFDRAEQIKDMPDAELGSIGSLAVADWHFDRKEYDPAGTRYQKLYAAPDSFSRAYLDGLCFRLAYCHSQKQQWQEALTCLETLFQNYPGSIFDGKASCLYHVVAAQVYQAQATESAYARYIKAAECYVKNCSEARDASEAHFQLGRYYQHKERAQDALMAFEKVGSDSPHYPDARHAVLMINVNRLQSDVEELETLLHDGQGQSEKAVKRYRESLKRAEDCHKSFTGTKAPDGDSQLEAYLTLLLARLYLHAAEPSPRKALPLLQGFEKAFSIKQQTDLLYDMARKLRLESYLQLGMLKDAEQEMAMLTGTGAVDKTTWAFLAACADRHYSRAVKGQSQAAIADSGGDAQAALIIYKRLSDIAGKDSAYGRLYDQLRMRLAELYALDRQPAQAVLIYQEMLRRDPTSADALYNLAAVYEGQDKWEDAVSTWSKLARGLTPGDSHWFEARLRTAQALIRLGRHQEACEVIAVTTARHRHPADQVLKAELIRLQGEFCAKQDAAETVDQ